MNMKISRGTKTHQKFINQKKRLESKMDSLEFAIRKATNQLESEKRILRDVLKDFVEIVQDDKRAIFKIETCLSEEAALNARRLPEHVFWEGLAGAIADKCKNKIWDEKIDYLHCNSLYDPFDLERRTP